MKKSIRRYDRDTEYWNHYYERTASFSLQPSEFALETLKYLQRGKKLLELGCGNGRDSLFFGRNGINVTGIDASNFAIDALIKNHKEDNLRFICGDFVHSSILKQEKFDYCYARFVLHAISKEQETDLLINISDALINGGMLFVEARTIHDELYGKGVCVGEHEYIYNDHYRRFVDGDEMRKNLDKLGIFRILYMKEGKGFATTKTSDPTLMRIIAVKKDDKSDVDFK